MLVNKKKKKTPANEKVEKHFDLNVTIAGGTIINNGCAVHLHFSLSVDVIDEVYCVM